MKKIVCEVCGASDIIKMDGLFVCQSCGTKYSLEEARKLMAEGTATNDTNNEVQNFLKRAFMHLEEGSWKQADELLDQILNKAPENARAYLGKLMVQLKLKHEDQIKKLPISLQNNINYKRILQFGDKKLAEKITYVGNNILVDNFDEIASSKKDLVYKDSKNVIISENMLQYAFYTTNIEKAIILDGVTHIPEYAFNGCSSLKSVIIPDTVTTIGNSAFADCRSLTNLEIPRSVTSIGMGAFARCQSLESINIPDFVTSISDSAFAGCNSLKNIVIPNSVKNIGANAFSSCSFKNISIPNSVSSIGDRAFSFCRILENITIPNSVTSIGNSAFSYCEKLENINISNSLTNIGEELFYCCSSLKSIAIPNSVTIIEKNAFKCCTSLENITIPKSVLNIDWMAIPSNKSLHIKYEGTTEEWKKLNVVFYGSLHCADTDEKERRKKMEIMNRRINAGLCRHCGGSFKGVFSKECKNCGRKKDY